MVMRSNSMMMLGIYPLNHEIYQQLSVSGAFFCLGNFQKAKLCDKLSEEGGKKKLGIIHTCVNSHTVVTCKSLAETSH